MAELRGFLKAKLPEYMVPSAFVPLDALPLTPNGKVDRKALPAPEGLSQAGETLVGPRDALEIELVRIWEQLLGVQPISVTANFFDLGGHSLLAVQLMVRIRESTGRSLSVASLFESPTVEKMAALMRQEPAPWSPLVPIWHGGTRRPFFCVHPGGGNVVCYADLARALGPDQPFYGLQAPGLDGEQPPLETIEALAALYIIAIRAAQPVGPYLLGGWSLGGSIAFEMAQQLQRQDEQVALVVLFDAMAPQALGLEEPGPEEPGEANVHFVRDAEEFLGTTLGIPDEAARRMAQDEVLEHVLAAARRVQAVISTAGLAQIRGLRDVDAQNRRAARRYVPRPYDGALALFAATGTVLPESMPEDRGWAALSTRELAVYALPGDHLEIMRKPHVEALAQRLQECLARVQDAAPSSRKGAK